MRCSVWVSPKTMYMAWGRLSTSITMFPSKIIPTEDTLWWRDWLMFWHSWQRIPTGTSLYSMNFPHHYRPKKRNRPWSHQHDPMLQTASIGTQPTCLLCPVYTHYPVQRLLLKITQDREKWHPQMMWGEHRSQFWIMRQVCLSKQQ